LNNDGELGNGTTTRSLTPVTVSGLTNVVSISSAFFSNCAVKSDHTVWCWGANGVFGELGDGTTTNRSTPVQVSGITTATSVAISANHGCASLQNGTAVCWGNNDYGQLGNNTTTSSLTPVAVSNLTNVVSVAVSQFASCATLADGSTACWGRGNDGQLGNGAQSQSLVPVTVNAIP
jgi:alpha-tubulin suppressor-like RCC1 family protein